MARAGAKRSTRKLKISRRLGVNLWANSRSSAEGYRFLTALLKTAHGALWRGCGSNGAVGELSTFRGSAHLARAVPRTAYHRAVPLL